MTHAPADAAIVLPSYGRLDHVRDCLGSLAKLDGGPYRTIVVDDGSPEPLAPICAAAGDHVTCIRQDNAGPAAARNRGVQEAVGAKVVLFIDDDCRPRADWALQLLRAQAGDADNLTGGAVVNALEDNACSRAAQAILTYSYDEFGDFSDRLSFFTTNNLCVDRDAFLTMGGLDTGYRFASEDRDLSFRWKQAGKRLVHAPEAVIHHHHHLTLPKFLRQQFAYGRGARRFHRKVADAPDGGIKMGSGGFYSGLLLHPLRQPSPRAVVTTTLIGLAHAAMAAGYAAEWRAMSRDGAG